MSVKLEEIFRVAAPTHFLFKVESFSLLSKNSIVKYESNEFETGGYKWKLVFYPDGNKNEVGGDDHISLYLMLLDTTSLPACWGLNVVLKLFLFDQIRERYLIRGDIDGKTRHFHEMKKMSGFVQFLSLSKLNDPKNGYLLDDNCLFGAEVFVSKPRKIIECLSMVKEVTVKYTWKIENFTNIKEEFLYSEKFKAGDHNWNLLIYPRGNSGGKNNSVSLYLSFPDCLKDTGLKAYAGYKLQIMDQINGKHIEKSTTDNCWFHHALKNWGRDKFIGLSEMNDKRNGYLVKDTCIVEAEVKVLGVVFKRT